MDTYSRRAWSNGGGFGGKSGISAGFWVGDGTEDCCLRYHGIEGEGDGVVSSAGADSAGVVAGFVLSLRKTNSGSSAEGSCLSTLAGMLVLRAHRAALEVVSDAVDEARGIKLLGRVVEAAARENALRQALQTKLDERVRAIYMLHEKASVERVPSPDGVAHATFLHGVGETEPRRSATPAAPSP